MTIVGGPGAGQENEGSGLGPKWKAKKGSSEGTRKKEEKKGVGLLKLVDDGTVSLFEEAIHRLVRVRLVGEANFYF